MNPDLVSIAFAVIAATIPVFGAIATVLITKYVGDAKAQMVLDKAVQNALGAIQQAVTAPGPEPVPIPHVPSRLLAGVRYVLDHHQSEVDRLGLTPEAIADRINAQIGLRALAIATVSPVAVVVEPPDAPVPPVQMPKPLYKF